MHLERLITVLEAVAIAGKPLAPSELHEMTGLPAPTCYRLLKLLADQHLLEDSDSNSRYVIGERLLRIAYLATTDTDVCDVTAPMLQNAASTLGEAVFLSRLREKGVTIISVQTPKNPSISYIHPGLGFRPMHACSCSKVIAAFSSMEFRSTILHGPMKAYTEQTRTKPEDLEIEFEAIKKRGYAECVEEIEVGVSSVAAPVQVANVGAVFSIGTIGPIRRFNAKHRKQLGGKLIDLATQVGSLIENSQTEWLPNSRYSAG